MDDAPGMAGPKPRRVFATDGMHLLRTVQQIQYQLSQMADQKASILLGITFVIFTITIGQAKAGGATAPVLILGSAAFLAAVLAILAVLPSIKAGPRVDGPRNVLFFSAFTQLPEDEFVAQMLDIVTDTQTIYECFAHDIYQNGRVLAGKKYKLLGYAYRVLLVGLVCSFMAFVAPYLFKALNL